VKRAVRQHQEHRNNLPLGFVLEKALVHQDPGAGAALIADPAPVAS